jgi:hypothetical protein
MPLLTLPLLTLPLPILLLPNLHLFTLPLPTLPLPTLPLPTLPLLILPLLASLNEDRAQNCRPKIINTIILRYVILPCRGCPDLDFDPRGLSGEKHDQERAEANTQDAG